jgi:hypothetical protein
MYRKGKKRENVLYLMSEQGLLSKRDMCIRVIGWALASRLIPPASAFRHPTSQSGTRAFRYRTESHCSGTGLAPASA